LENTNYLFTTKNLITLKWRPFESRTSNVMIYVVDHVCKGHIYKRYLK
jgi:hypothetical protein